MDVAIVVVVSGLAQALHVVLFVLFRRWMNRDLALSFAGDEPARRAYMLVQLQQARVQGIARRALPDWLARAAANVPDVAPAA
ncbi:hypothetical protein MNO14_02235 [Luteimonas sp. S4-F44]|uniref:hypothetical protein n=1 Tax=Luteimonas sp. S4-F44 TaxID=2925842 RepID=UPI001F533848|nr:hypothetical protein [Luteimonas sp. S4-F44]UNK42944.1 hypothetical protein MNO14_02235 [Luteimonas sp. S4-F44]